MSPGREPSLTPRVYSGGAGAFLTLFSSTEADISFNFLLIKLRQSAGLAALALICYFYLLFELIIFRNRIE